MCLCVCVYVSVYVCVVFICVCGDVCVCVYMCVPHLLRFVVLVARVLLLQPPFLTVRAVISTPVVLWFSKCLQALAGAPEV